MATDAAHAFFGQASDFNQTMGSIVAGASLDILKAGIVGSQAILAYEEALLVDRDGKPRAPIPMKEHFGFVDKGAGLDVDTEFDMSLPLFMVAQQRLPVIETASIEMRMNIKAVASDTNKYKATQSLTVTESAGWLAFQQGSKLIATGAESGKSTRSSDYRSKSDIKVGIGLCEVPEGVHRALDFYHDLYDIQKDLMLRKAATAAQAQAQHDGLADSPADGGQGDSPVTGSTGSGGDTGTDTGQSSDSGPPAPDGGDDA